MSLLRIALAWLTLGATISHAAERYQMPDSVPARAAASRMMRAADADESLEMSVTLRLRQANELAGLISAQQDPQSPEYHRWLTPDEFAARFAPAPADYAAVADWLHREHFVVHPTVSRTRIDFSGTVASVEHTFAVRMNHYSHRGRTPLANADPPLLPPEFAATVDFVRLNTFPLAEPLVRVDTVDGLVTAMAPADMYRAYGMQTLLDTGVDGAGQTIAVVARSDFRLSDVASFQQQFGVPAHSPVKAFASTNPGIGAPNGICQGIRNQRELQLCIEEEEGEVLLDTEWASAMAPGATVLVDIGATDIDASLLDIVTNHPEVTAITMSFGACERLDSSDLGLFGNLYAQAAAQGQAVFVSTGDDGSDGCQDGRGRSVNVLASNENVTAVGGTALDPGFNASGNATGYISESVWHDSDGASGGGASTLVLKPSYQNAPGVPTDGARDQPDVSFLASPSNAGYVMVVEGTVAVTGGTSAAAPSWAGIAALLNHALRVDASGPPNATLYALGRQQYAGTGAAVFHDVIHGNNSFNGVLGYDAGTGYDLASGLGTPDVAALAQALGALGDTPTPTPTPAAPPSCIGDCHLEGAVTVDDLLTLVNISLGTENISTCAAADANGDGQVTIDEILAAVNSALDGCAG